MTKTELQLALAESTQTNKRTAAVFLDTLSALAYKEIKKNGEFVLPGFGKLVKQKKKARSGINPNTHQKIKIPARTVVKFRIAKAAKDAISGVAVSDGGTRVLPFSRRGVSRLSVAPGSSEPAYATFVLDKVSGIESLGDDLRDDKTRRLDAKKIGQLFNLSIAAIAKAAGITEQALDQNPMSLKAQPILMLFERVARLRSNPQFSQPTQLQKWFRQSLDIFGNHSGENLFHAGKLEVVAAKVDQILTGDFGG